MKMSLALVLLAFAPALMAQDPETIPPTQPPIFKDPIPAQEDLAEHAALVQQIGEAAAKGFDAEAHARALRQQIEAVMAKSATDPVPSATEPAAVTPVKPPLTGGPLKASGSAGWPASAATATDPSSHAREVALRQAIQKLRAVLADLESQLEAGTVQH